ncbi:MAG: hypothetical protein IJX62_01155, partial [Clostridia bacterium]|nr:hypothetical protein [Clostridia bacterium]
MKHLQAHPQEDQASASTGSNKRFAIIAISVFLSMLTLPMLLWGVLLLIPNGTAPFEVTMQENRNPAEMPEVLDLRTLTADLEACFNDRIPFRSLLISSYQNLTNSVEKPYKEQVRPYLVELFFGNTSTTPPPSQPPIDLDNDLIFGDTGKETDDTTTEPWDESLPPPVVDNQGDPNCTHVLSAGQQITPATCEEDGWGEVRKVCSNCSYSVTVFTARAEHQMELTQQLEPTCLADGQTVHTCKVCQTTTRQTLKGGHVGALMRSVAPSYADYGFRLHKCVRCSGEY